MFIVKLIIAVVVIVFMLSLIVGFNMIYKPLNEIEDFDNLEERLHNIHMQNTTREDYVNDVHYDAVHKQMCNANCPF